MRTTRRPHRTPRNPAADLPLLLNPQWKGHGQLRREDTVRARTTRAGAIILLMLSTAFCTPLPMYLSGCSMSSVAAVQGGKAAEADGQLQMRQACTLCLVFVTELHGLVDAGGSAGGHSSTEHALVEARPLSPASQVGSNTNTLIMRSEWLHSITAQKASAVPPVPLLWEPRTRSRLVSEHVALDGRVAARVKDLAANDLCDRARRRLPKVLGLDRRTSRCKRLARESLGRHARSKGTPTGCEAKHDSARKGRRTMKEFGSGAFAFTVALMTSSTVCNGLRMHGQLEIGLRHGAKGSLQ